MSYIDLEAKAEAQGTNYKTRDLLQDIDSNFGQAQNISDSVHTFNFSNSDLIGGVLTLTHDLDTAYPKPLIRRPDGTYEDALKIMTYITSNRVSFDFNGAITSGTWVGQISI